VPFSQILPALRLPFSCLTEVIFHRYDFARLNRSKTPKVLVDMFPIHHYIIAKGVGSMKAVTSAVAIACGVLLTFSVTWANPALLPKHEGYPMKNSGSPVTGQPTANDPGQSDARGESTLMKSADSVKNAQQNLVKQDNARITEGQGAGRLPNVQGPQIQIAPPVTSATKITEDRKIQ
jgi:hypothetical protein